MMDKIKLMKCEKCGEPLPENARFCRNCGHEIRESLLKRYKLPILFLAIALILALIAIVIFSGFTYNDVQVGPIDFRIPDGFGEEILPDSFENDSGIVTVSKMWFRGEDVIKITVMYAGDTYVDANIVNHQVGGHKEKMLGYDGFLRKNNGVYSFSFVKDNTLITIYVTDINLFDEIKVL